MKVRLLEKIRWTSVICGTLVFYVFHVIESYKLTNMFDFAHFMLIIFIGIFILLSLKNDRKIKSLLEDGNSVTDFYRKHGIIAIDKDNGKVVYVNRIACNILKKEKEELVGKNLKDIPVCCLLTCDENFKI